MAIRMTLALGPAARFRHRILWAEAVGLSASRKAAGPAGIVRADLICYDNCDIAEPSCNGPAQMSNTIKVSSASESGEEEINVRLAFEAARPKDIERWVHWLCEAGLSVTGSSQRGIDLRGTVPNIESALETTIDLKGGKVPSIGDIGRKVGSAKSVPVAYVPQKPRYFP